jgi:hypothetical protein
MGGEGGKNQRGVGLGVPSDSLAALVPPDGEGNIHLRRRNLPLKKIR